MAPSHLVRPAAQGILTVNGALALNPAVTVSFDILGATPGTLHDRLTVTGGVSLNNAVLSLTGTFAANASTQFVLIDNTGGSPSSGRSPNLPENATFQAANGVTYRINYTGGTGATTSCSPRSAARSRSC